MSDEIKGSILFVDDEENILRSIKRSLLDEPYEMFFANNGIDALQILGKNKISVIVTDMRMPGMNGLELLETVKEMYPDVVRIVLTGYSQISTLITAINSGQIYRYLVKPWKLDTEFKPALKQAIEFYNLNAERIKIIKELRFKTLELENQMKEKEYLLNKIEETDKRKDEIITLISSRTIPFIDEALTLINNLINANNDIDTNTKNILAKLRDNGNKVVLMLKKVKSMI